MPIQVLSVHLVNKIAAGEVIERPASIVKELVENALDAGATRIDVTVEDGGRKLIAVTDDGGGMGADDLALAFAPHATSKIAGEEDLFHIETMGFRGEALASVASVAHSHIRTRRAQDDSGHEIDASGETVGEVRPCAGAPGTTVTIRDLFFNTPARRKFMRKANTEFGHITEQLTRLALPHPQVAFTLTHNGRATQNLPPAESTRDRVGDLFGAEMGESLLPVVSRGGTVDVRGLIAPPAGARASGKWQYLFLNGRFIRDRSLSHALREAYRGLLEPSRWPVAFLFLRLDPAAVDVNVHPTKIEVRFRDGNAVHGELLAALRETLNKANLAPTASLAAAGAGFGEPPADASQEQRRASLREAMADFFRSTPAPQPRLGFPQHRPPGAPADAPSPPTMPPMPLTPASSAAAPTQEMPDAHEAAEPFPRAVQLHNSYIISADADGLVIIDQHALHERILYNDLKRRLTEGALVAQRMLIPQTFEVTVSEMAALAAHRELLASLGIEVDPFGPRTLAVQKFPSLLAERGVEAAPFLREVLDRLADDETTDSERLLEDVLEMLACKAAVKAGDPLTDAELHALLARREETEKASSCPHGRPTTLKLTLRDLEKQFKRT